MSEIIHKLDAEICSRCEQAGKNDIAHVIIFADCKSCSSDDIRRQIESHGGHIRYELKLLNAFAVDIYARRIKEVAEKENIIYIASDINASTCMNVARAAIGDHGENYLGEGVCAAVIDTGIYPHNDLTANGSRIAAFVDFVGGKKKPYDDNGHGTHVSGILAGDGYSSNGRYAGIAPKASLAGLKVMDSRGSGRTSDILAALDWVHQNRERYNIRVASLSLGAPAGERRTYDPLIYACERLWDSGILVVAAAGNEGPMEGSISSPGASAKIITVGASDDKRTIERSDDTIADFSSRGPSLYSRRKPDVCAPGVNIVSLANSSSGYTVMSGTSMATPIISGLAVRLFSQNPDLTPGEVKAKLRRSVYSVGDSPQVQGSGVTDAGRLIR